MRFTYRAAGPVAAAAVLTLVAACSRTQQDWRVAQQANTARAYNVFVQRHPDSELAGVARQRIAQLTDEAAWQQATRANTAAAYRDYLTRYPQGSWSQDARIRMESRSLAAQPPPGAGPVAPGAAEPQAQPQTPVRPAEPALRTGGPAARTAESAVNTADRPAVAAAGSADTVRSAVQLGAFSSEANARSAWGRLSSRFRAELGGLTPRVVPVSLSGRQLYRLEAVVADQTAARRLCGQLVQHSQGCLPVP
jgi:cell division septation protein DedD